jgi:hypothetical protein
VKVQAQQESTDAVIKMPQKKFFRQRAHANPFSDHRISSRSDWELSPVKLGNPE